MTLTGLKPRGRGKYYHVGFLKPLFKPIGTVVVTLEIYSTPGDFLHCDRSVLHNKGLPIIANLKTFIFIDFISRRAFITFLFQLFIEIKYSFY